MYKIISILLCYALVTSSCENDTPQKPSSTPRKSESQLRASDRIPVHNASQGLEYLLEWNNQRAMAKFDLKENELVTYHFEATQDESIYLSVAGQNLGTAPQIISITDPEGKVEVVHRAKHQFNPQSKGRFSIEVGTKQGENFTGIFSLKISRRPKSSTQESN